MFLPFRFCFVFENIRLRDPFRRMILSIPHQLHSKVVRDGCVSLLPKKNAKKKNFDILCSLAVYVCGLFTVSVFSFASSFYMSLTIQV